MNLIEQKHVKQTNETLGADSGETPMTSDRVAELVGCTHKRDEDIALIVLYGIGALMGAVHDAVNTDSRKIVSTRSDILELRSIVRTYPKLVKNH